MQLIISENTINRFLDIDCNINCKHIKKNLKNFQKSIAKK